MDVKFSAKKSITKIDAVSTLELKIFHSKPESCRLFCHRDGVKSGSGQGQGQGHLNQQTFRGLNAAILVLLLY